MLHREDPDGLIVISQPAHAWVSGQLARAWGNDRFGQVEPREEVCLAAEQHDIGWTDWERAPTWNAKTGLPYVFFAMPRETHLRIWTEAGEKALTFCRYTALLVSLHGTGLYERYNATLNAPEEAQAVERFLAEQHSFQGELLASLRRDERYSRASAAEPIDRNRSLIRVWDRLSIALCTGLREERKVDGVPTADGEAAFTLRPAADDPSSIIVSPWPFAGREVALGCEGRRLAGPFPDQEAMRAAWSRAPWVRIAMRLRPP